VRYPNFARLARDGTWFPYATASLDETARAMRSLFTGRTTWRFAHPTYSAEPRNLFTLLGRRYRMDVSEEVSSMCHERYLRRRREDEETRAIWQDFERTTPISEPEPDRVEEPERTETEPVEELTASER
jgi:hypothetical protein